MNRRTLKAKNNWQADNGVWLTDRVDPAFLQPAEPNDDPNSE